MLHRPVPTALPASLLAAALLAAAAPCARAQASLTPAPPAHSVWFDAGALLDNQVRAGAEVVALGRFTAGLAIAYSHTPHPRGETLVPPYAYLSGGTALPACDPGVLSLCAYPCAYPGCYYGSGEASGYRAWAFDLSVRWYPEALAFRNGVARLLVYSGAYAGYHWRRWDEQPLYYYPYCPPGYACPAVTDSGAVPLPPYPVAYPSPLRHTLKGLEPGLEVGVRLLPVGPLFLEAGGRFTLVVVDDPMQRAQQGDVEARLVLAAGLAW